MLEKEKNGQRQKVNEFLQRAKQRNDFSETLTPAKIFAGYSNTDF